MIDAAPALGRQLEALEESISITTAADDMAPHVERLARHMRRVFNVQRADFLRRFSKLKTLYEVAALLDWDEAAQESDWGPAWDEAALASIEVFRGPLEETIQASVDAGIKAAIADLHVSFSFDLKNPRAVSYLDHRAADRVALINAETRKQLRTIISAGADDGRTYQQIAKDIRDRFDGFSGKSPLLHIRDRAELVAVTEVGDGYEEGNREVALGLNERGLPMEKKWVDVGDDRVDPGCRSNSAAGWIGINDHFPTGHMRPLEHPGCRCHVQYRRKPTPATVVGATPTAGDTPTPIRKPRTPAKARRKIRPEEPPAALTGRERKEYRMGHVTDKITAEVERLTGLPSKWSGKVFVPPADKKSPWYGLKAWACDISIREDAADRISTRYPTLIHEVLHSVSNDMLPSTYAKMVGWEEGVVEGLQRLLRPAIMKRRFPDLQLEDELFAAASDKYNGYNPWVQTLQLLAKELGVPEKRFFLDLIKTPLEDRPAYVRELGRAKYAGTAEENRWRARFILLDKKLRRRTP